MAKLWEGRTDGHIDQAAERFNASISFDCRLYREDITGSIAHAEMLAKVGILEKGEAETICEALRQILRELDGGILVVDASAEDVHTFVEETLTARIGDLGKKLHTARSRNDQVALDMRLYARKACGDLQNGLKKLIEAVVDQAERCKGAIVSGYTHLQRAQPITFGHQLMAYAMMFLRDVDRIGDCAERLDCSPIGACALAGTTYPIDRGYEAGLLGFGAVAANSIDAVSDRDYLVELLADLSLVMTHLSRFAEEIILWSSWEFGYIKLSDAYTTGSSIMPQKKNADIAELTRGKTGRVYGDLVSMLTVLKGLPLAYNKDMQEDKECVFDAVDTVEACLEVFAPMVATFEADTDAMLKAAKRGFINATDVADYLTKKGVPFRAAYHVVGQIVNLCVKENKTLEDLPLEIYKSFDKLFEADIYEEIALENCVNRRISEGGTSVASVEKQIAYVKERLNTL
ncbi:MAG: argininosuccinate lyase [Clostridia bacterium]|nr:argininosuccinate lyase [Clostridia bacterium]